MFFADRALARRLAFAAAAYDVAMVSTLPGSAAQRNVERQGVQIMYTRSKVRRN